MFPAIALALLGPRLAGSLAFPLLFLLFAVPFGEIFVAPLIQFTADFTVAAVRATGIPVLRSGTRFELPTGNWSVVEACSGVRYLISSITLGCLYAYLTYRSTLRRAPVHRPVGRGADHRQRPARLHDRDDRPPVSGMALATGVDHLIYGWLFFGLVMFIMFWIGSYWREDEAPAPGDGFAAPAHRHATAPAGRGAGQAHAAMAWRVLAVCALWPALRAFNASAPTTIRRRWTCCRSWPISWPQVAGLPDWKPAYMEPDAALRRSYMRGATPGRT
jgi:hypothetical protein